MPITTITTIKKHNLKKEVEQLKKVGLISFSLTVKENNDGVKELIMPRWSEIDYDNCSSFIHYKDNGMCIKTGKMSSIFVLDIDKKDKEGYLNGMTLWNQLIEENGDIDTWITRSANGGLHYYFKYDNSTCDFPTRTNIVINNVETTIDIRNDGGIIIAPPTSYISIEGIRKTYTWVKSPHNTKLAEMPEWLYKLINVDVNKIAKTNGIQIKHVNKNITNSASRTNSIDTKKLKSSINLSFSKSYTKGSKHYVYYTGKCITCGKEHGRNDGQYLTIGSTISDIMRLTFKCFHNINKFSTIKITRNNPQKITYSDKGLKKQFRLNNAKLKNLMSFIPLGTYEI
ncbi:MAG: hypothetical protein Homavirus50_3 [Homavirus sp.]|uniref:DNA primase/polymerase bifunctional N-terminal domain-containing protein n=1 Tax=Homavirus sp. TaxID=2487769 RepID=A0A3G5A5A2_9VIRU|nr:MAG: hypothetical protein Homavirus50_3 [Homavirus sp.]